jgi:hypothetical protein
MSKAYEFNSDLSEQGYYVRKALDRIRKKSPSYS